MPSLQQPTPALDNTFQRAIRHHNAGEIAEAERLYRRLLAAGRETANANHNLGILLLQRRQVDAAIPHLRTALDHDPAETQFWLSYADALLQAGQLQQVRQALAEAERHGVRTEKTAAFIARLDIIAGQGAQPGVNWVPGLRGDVYLDVLDRLHGILQPKTYLEVGVQTGATLALARCASIGVDPQFQFGDMATVRRLVAKPSLSLYQMPSDDFFARFNPTLLFGAPIDFAFLDGMHRCEYLLRDFLNTERHCSPSSVIALHDCLPLELPMAERDPNAKAIEPGRQAMWTGDVWRTALLLKRRRPDLRMLVLDSAPTGLVLIGNLNSDNHLLADDYAALLAEMMSWSLAELTLAGYYKEICVEPEILFRTSEQILTRLHGASCPAPRLSLVVNPYPAGRAKRERPRGKRAAARRRILTEPPSTQPSQPSHQETAAIMALYRQARYSEAERLARSLVARLPNHGFAWKALGVMLQKQGRFEEALEVKQRSAALLAGDAEAQNNLGNALLKLDHFEEAASSYRKALALRSDYAEAESGLGITLHKLGQLEEAEKRCRRALVLQPNFADAASNLGIVLQDAGRLAEAEASYRRALRIDLNHADAWNNLGITLQKLNRLSEAEAAHRKAIEIDPKYADALTNLAGCLLQLARLTEAETCYRQAIDINPGQLNACTNLLFCLSHKPATTPEALFAEHLCVGARFEAPHRAAQRPHTNSRDPGRPLKVGIVSADLRTHATSHFIEPALTHLACQPSIELHAYANHLIDDDVTKRFRVQIPRWNRVAGLSDDALAAKIRADRIDILVDLSGHTAGHRLSTFARKPAPLQCGWIGYLGTSGMHCMDYYLADPFYLPPGEFDRFFIEKLLQIPAIAPFQPSEMAPLVNPLPALANGYVTFASFSRMAKLNPAVVALWSELLHALPGSKLLLGAMASEREFATPSAWFTANGISADRLQFRLGARMSDYLQLHHEVDICLDPFPFTGGTTTGHALWMGVPTLTLAGRTAPGRLGAAMLRHVGLDGFVADSPEDFFAKGLNWAWDLDALADLRATLRDRFQQSRLGQAEAFAQGLAESFRRIWQMWCG
jgi:predicted O-linked N-acetylglucosamine transferase (SPINDLY family)